MTLKKNSHYSWLFRWIHTRWTLKMLDYLSTQECFRDELKKKNPRRRRRRRRGCKWALPKACERWTFGDYELLEKHRRSFSNRSILVGETRRLQFLHLLLHPKRGGFSEVCFFCLRIMWDWSSNVVQSYDWGREMFPILGSSVLFVAEDSQEFSFVWG